jgi:hypothetical protein
MPGWDDLPDDIKEKIMQYTLLAPFRGGNVPSMGQLAVNAGVSKSVRKIN